MSSQDKCFACGRALGQTPTLADTRDNQLVYVGRSCLKLVRAAGSKGHQPPKGGPRLWLVAEPTPTSGPRQEAIDRLAAALTHWRGLEGLATRPRMRSCANRFGVNPKTFEAAIVMLRDLS